jgi:hypothetical protein
MSEKAESNPLSARVDELVRRQQEDSQRAVQEVPLLTEVVEPDTAASREAKRADAALIDDIERVLLVRLLPEINKQIAVLRGDLEKELRKAVREAVGQAVAAARKAKPVKR